MTYISFILKPCDLKFGMHVLKTLLCFMKLTDYTYDILFDFFKRLKRVGSVLSSSELGPFPYTVYGIIQFGPKAGLAPVSKTFQISSFLTTISHL